MLSDADMPSLNFLKAMGAEHSRIYEFTTSNYNLTTTPRKEWAIVVESKMPENSQMSQGRVVPNARMLDTKRN